MFKKIGIIREGKAPPDRRVPLTPKQCHEAMLQGIDIAVQRSPVRAYTDAEYTAQNVRVTEDLTDRDLIIGVKEVPLDMLMADKAYLFFSHTIKQQPHNAKLLHTVLDRRITLIDHELLTNTKGQRVLAFGKWAGVVGAYNAVRAWQVTTEGPLLKSANACHDRAEMDLHLAAVQLPKDLRIVLTGTGRVGHGAMETLDRAGVINVSPNDFLQHTFDHPVYTILGSADLYVRDDGEPFDRAAFHADPRGHRAEFLPFIKRAQIYIACHFWDARGPKILSAEDLRDPDIKLRVVADISCDIGGPIDSTLRASTIADPFFGYDPATEKECPVGKPGSITVMSVDNLPCELPRDSSKSFGRDLMTFVLPHLTGDDGEGMIDRATIAKGGKLTGPFKYLADYAAGGSV
ncbi:MAG: NAD(P)-dependent oxidoreductase [Flavobacteriales bacterium]|jgi:alanine dehydrogenase|nr:NAD(P)-dependent oxidoreductase [Flavobacteriales bacterium]MCB0759097.1 alanine dehydrogenase [Flavobacteriales bacterium]